MLASACCEVLGELARANQGGPLGKILSELQEEVVRCVYSDYFAPGHADGDGSAGERLPHQQRQRPVRELPYFTVARRLETEKNDLERERNDMKQRLGKQQKLYRGMEMQCGNVKARLDDERKAHNEVKVAHTKLRAQSQDLQERLTRATASIRTLKNENATLEHQKEEQASELQQQIRIKALRNNALQAELNRGLAELSACKDQLVSMLTGDDTRESLKKRAEAAEEKLALQTKKLRELSARQRELSARQREAGISRDDIASEAAFLLDHVPQARLGGMSAGELWELVLARVTALKENASKQNWLRKLSKRMSGGPKDARDGDDAPDLDALIATLSGGGGSPGRGCAIGRGCPPFVGLGTAPSIPRFLRCAGKIACTPLAPFALESLVRDVWIKKEQYDREIAGISPRATGKGSGHGSRRRRVTASSSRPRRRRGLELEQRSTLGEFFSVFVMQKAKGDPAAAAATAYNVLDGLRRHRDDASCALFLAILEGRHASSLRGT